MTATKEQVNAALEMVRAVGDAIREAGEVPSGHLYAVLMGKVDLAGYERMVDMLVGAGLVERAPNHLLRWVGPAKEAA